MKSGVKSFSLLLLVAAVLYWNWQSLVWAYIHFLGRFSLPVKGDVCSFDGCGGAGFVELCTGFNLALVSIRELRERLRFVEEIFASFADSRASSILDAEQRERAGILYEQITEWWKKLNEAMWYFCFSIAIGMTFLGAWMLYVNQYCEHSWFLVLPWFCYFVWMTVCLALLWVISKIVTSVCNVLNPQSPKNDIDALNKLSKQTTPQGVSSTNDSNTTPPAIQQAEQPVVPPPNSPSNSSAGNGNRNRRRKSSGK